MSSYLNVRMDVTPEDIQRETEIKLERMYADLDEEHEKRELAAKRELVAKRKLSAKKELATNQPLQEFEIYLDELLSMPGDAVDTSQKSGGGLDKLKELQKQENTGFKGQEGSNRVNMNSVGSQRSSNVDVNIFKPIMGIASNPGLPRAEENRQQEERDPTENFGYNSSWLEDWQRQQWLKKIGIRKRDESAVHESSKRQEISNDSGIKQATIPGEQDVNFVHMRQG